MVLVEHQRQLYKGEGGWASQEEGSAFTVTHGY